MEEVDVEAVDGRAVLAQPVEVGFAASPVVVTAPVIDQTLQLMQRRPLARVGHRRPAGPPDGFQSSLQVGQLVIGHGERPRTDGGAEVVQSHETETTLRADERLRFRMQG